MLQVNNLSKKYKKSERYSLKDVSFSLNTGEIVGLIGKNGAGKTTLMKMLVKTLIPTTGEILLNNKNIFENDNQLGDVGILIEPAYYSQLTVLENLNFYLAVNRKESYRSNIQSVLELVDLWTKKDDKPNSFSFGMKQRLSLAMCLITEPKFAIMDEPFVGLDPVGIADLIDALKKWVKEKNMTILISSHQLAELDELCDRFMYIENGRLANSFENENELTRTLIINLKNVLDQQIITESFDLKMTKNNSLEIPSNLSNLNELLKYLSNKNEIVSIESKENEQLKNYFIGE